MHKSIPNGEVNSKALMCVGAELNKCGVVRSKSDSGIAMKTLTLTTVTKEEVKHGASE